MLDLYDKKDHPRAGVWKAYRNVCPKIQGPTKFVKIRDGKRKGEWTADPKECQKQWCNDFEV